MLSETYEMTTVATQHGSILSTLCMEAKLVKQIFECLYEYERRFRRCCFLKPESISFHFFCVCAFSCLSVCVSMFHRISELIIMSLRILHEISRFSSFHTCVLINAVSPQVHNIFLTMKKY